MVKVSFWYRNKQGWVNFFFLYKHQLNKNKQNIYMHFVVTSCTTNLPAFAKNLSHLNCLFANFSWTFSRSSAWMSNAGNMCKKWSLGCSYFPLFRHRVCKELISSFCGKYSNSLHESTVELSQSSSFAKYLSSTLSFMKAFHKLVPF